MPSTADSDRPLADRLDSMLQQMSRDEKVAQLIAVDVAELLTDGELDSAKLSTRLSDGCALLTGLAELVEDAQSYRVLAAQLSEYVTRQTRLGIPVFICESSRSLETLLTAELTINPLAMSASFAPTLVSDFASRYRDACLDLTVDQILVPSLAIDAQHESAPHRLSAGADPYLAGRVAVAFLRGMRGAAPDRSVLACATGFVAQALVPEVADAGKADDNSADVGRRALREIYAEPFSAAIREAGLAAVVVADMCIDGVPCVGAEEVLGDLLREELGYKGLVISAERGIRNLVERHRVAADYATAATQALNAGVDIDLDGELFSEELLAALNDGSVSVDTLDQAVRRVLQCKFQFGLFAQQDVEADEEPSSGTLSPPFEASAASLHEAATVLLKNTGGCLPLAGDCRLQVADTREGLLVPALQAQGFVVDTLSIDRSTAASAAQQEVAVVCIGEVSAPATANNADADGYPAAQAAFSSQLELLDQLTKQGVPTVVILDASALPLASRLPAEVSAVLIAWEFRIGPVRAVAGVLGGAVNPSGRLPLALPASVDSALDGAGYGFGHGLSFSHFEYRELLCADTVDTHGAVEVRVEVVNESASAGVEVVQLYAHDPVADTSRPTRQLIGFHRLALAAGQSKSVIFQLDVSQFGYYNRRLEYVVDPGLIQLLAGSSSVDIRVRRRLSVQGDLRVFKQQQRLATQSRELELSP